MSCFRSEFLFTLIYIRDISLVDQQTTLRKNTEKFIEKLLKNLFVGFIEIIEIIDIYGIYWKITENFIYGKFMVKFIYVRFISVE